MVFIKKEQEYLYCYTAVMVSIIFIIGLIYIILDDIYSNKQKIKINLSEDGLTETEQLAYIIAAECLQCDSIEKSLVGSVVLNRVDTEGFPDTIEGVITEESAFHGYCAEQYMYDPISYDIASKLIQGHSRDTSVLYFYRNTLKKPNWVKKILYKKEYHNYGK